MCGFSSMICEAPRAQQVLNKVNITEDQYLLNWIHTVLERYIAETIASNSFWKSEIVNKPQSLEMEQNKERKLNNNSHPYL